MAGVDLIELERRLREAIHRFEPRLIAETVKVRAVTVDEMHRRALTFQIDAQLWSQPAPLHLLLKTEMDLESGETTVSEQVETRRQRGPGGA
jgi:type VI secretion system protein ImpF